MDIIVAGLLTLLIAYCFGLMFFFGGINFLMDFNPDFDSIRKKHSAILDTILGAVLLILINLFFWLVLYPFFVLATGLKLPVPYSLI